MGKKLYIGNLPFSMTEEQLHEKFASVGEVESTKIVFDRDTGRSKGFGFVEMINDDDALAAIEQLNGAEIGGRALIVSEARPQAPRTGGGFERGGRGGGGRGGGRDFGSGGGGRGRF